MLKKLHTEAMQDKENQIKLMKKKMRKLKNELEELRTLNMLHHKEHFSSCAENASTS